MNYDKEIEEGQVVRMWMCEELPLLGRGAGDGDYTVSAKKTKYCTRPILVILPPKPLEATGVHSDSENCTCVPSPRCAAISQTKLNCRPVTLVEKEPK